MSDPVLTPIGRDEVVGYLARQWPPAPAAVCLRVGPDFCGAVAVYPIPGRPGTNWWAVDGLIPPQSAGEPDEALRDLVAVAVPDAALEQWPAAPDPSAPPLTP